MAQFFAEIPARWAGNKLAGGQFSHSKKSSHPEGFLTRREILPNLRNGNEGVRSSTRILRLGAHRCFRLFDQKKRQSWPESVERALLFS